MQWNNVKSMQNQTSVEEFQKNIWRHSSGSISEEFRTTV